MTVAGPILEAERIVKRFGAFTAVDDVSLHVRAGEFLTLLGPSGCGKTTLLRVIAGFEQPNSGELRIAGRSMEGVQPYDRPVAIVFQNLALFPHMTVGENIAFGLEVRRETPSQIARRIAEVLELVGLADAAARRIHELSGGQRQRVALARSIVIRPSVMLLDEPLGALDLKLRRQLQVELKRIQKQLGTTFIFVTHDQDEALTMSDRIAVFNRGRIVKLDTPGEIYNRPCNRFVAQFIGDANFVPALILKRDGRTAQVTIGGLGTSIPALDPPDGNRAELIIRPENICVGDQAPADGWCLPARVVESVYAGSSIRYTLQAADITLLASAPAGRGSVALAPGTSVFVSWRPEDAILHRPDDAEASAAEQRGD